jgi:hypothetical protein
VSAKVFVNVSMDAEADKDILAWLAKQPNKSEAMRAAARAYLGLAGITPADVLQAVRDLERKIKSGAVVVREQARGDPNTTEPPDVAAALDKLAEL